MPILDVMIAIAVIAMISIVCTRYSLLKGLRSTNRVLRSIAADLTILEGALVDLVPGTPFQQLRFPLWFGRRALDSPPAWLILRSTTSPSWGISMAITGYGIPHSAGPLRTFVWRGRGHSVVSPFSRSADMAKHVTAWVQYCLGDAQIANLSAEQLWAEISACKLPVR